MHLAALGICYFGVALVATVILVAREVIQRRRALRRYRVRVVTIGPSLSRAFRQQPRPISRGDLDMPPARRSPMGDPLRTRVP